MTNRPSRHQIATGMVLSRGYDYGHVRGFGSFAFAIGSLGFVVAELWSISDTSSVGSI